LLKLAGSVDGPENPRPKGVIQSNFDVAAVLSNDSDLVEPIRIVTKVLGKPVGLLSPVQIPRWN
jgi:hypothetical protein